MYKELVYKPNPAKIAMVLKGYPIEKVRFILDFVGIVIERLRDDTLKDYNWCIIADNLGILSEVEQIVDAFDMPEKEFWDVYGKI